jgi:hypothetical protein
VIAHTTGGGGGGYSGGTTGTSTTTNNSGGINTASNSCNCAWWDVVCLAQCAGSDISNAFSGAPKYITSGVLPYLKTLPTIGGYVSEIPNMSTDISAIQSGMADIPAIGAGVLGIEAATKYLPSIDSWINNKINPNLNIIMSNIQSLPSMAQNIMKIPSEISSGLSGLVPYFGGLETYMVNQLSPITTKLNQAERYLQNMAQVPTNVAETLALSQEIEQDITKLPQEFPVEIVTLEDYMNYELGNLESWIGKNVSTTGIEQGISTIEKGVTQIESELKNLPKNIEKYVEEGVDTALKNLWKDIEIPVLAIGGLAFLMWMQPSNCCPRPVYRPHMPSEVI